MGPINFKDNIANSIEKLLNSNVCLLNLDDYEKNYYSIVLDPR